LPKRLTLTAVDVDMSVVSEPLRLSKATTHSYSLIAAPYNAVTHLLQLSEIKQRSTLVQSFDKYCRRKSAIIQYSNGGVAQLCLASAGLLEGG